MQQPPKIHGRVALVLQFWAGDREAAMRNARRIADNEPVFRKDVEFVFAARFDCAHDPDTIAYVSKKFKVSTFTSSRRETGWPAGCNGLWCDWVCVGAMSRVLSGEWEDVKCMFTFEADSIPVVPDWIDQLSAEWSKAATDGRYIVGCWMPIGPVGHINGNALFAPDLYRRQPCVLGCHARQGWDAAFAMQFEPHWMKTPLITNYYQNRDVAEEHFRRVAPDGRVPAVVHGVKDLSCETYADKVLRKPSRAT